MSNSQTYTVQQTAKLSGLPESTLRYYETMKLIPHIKRDERSKHRVYSEQDLEIVVTVACLSATGMSIDDMKAYMKSATQEGNSAQIQIQLLKEQAQHLLEEDASLRIRQDYVQAKIAYWNAVESGDPKKIELAKNKSIKIAKKLKNIKKKEKTV